MKKIREWLRAIRNRQADEKDNYKALMDEYDVLWNKYRDLVYAPKSKITLVHIQKPPVIDAAKLLEIFAVDPETPWLQAVLSVLAGREEVKKEEAAICELTDSQRSFHAGGIREMADAQEQILDLVKKGNEVKKGRKKE